jgi:hypothetical protein
MFYLIENTEQLSKLHPYGDCYINVIPLSPQYHPLLTQTSLIYFKQIDSKGLMFTINHSESFSIDKQKVKDFILKHERVFVLDKKITSQLLGEEFLDSKVIDLQIVSLSNTTIHPYIHDFDTYIHTHFKQLYGDKPYLNSIIPISKHYQTQESIYNVIKELTVNPTINTYYNDDYIKVYYGIEKQGIMLNIPVFNEYFNPLNPV